MKHVELLAPVGSYEAFLAAIQNDADAVYLGGKQFGARAYADNFSLNDIKEIIKHAHLYEKKVYITVNTIIFENEIKDLIEYLDFLYLNDCDGIIVQDLGIVNIVNERYPNFDLHASTQMNIHTVEQAKKLKELGFRRIVLARELPIEDIIEIKNNVDIEIEVFVHGALCVCYSGNCYMSSIIGKRSGNRGRCAQPCRLKYSLNDSKESKYLISPKDLKTIESIDKLIEAGIDSLKIEGRMKRSEYVGGVVKYYKEAINSYYKAQKFDLETANKNLKLLFNREFTKGYIFGENNDDFTNIESSNHIGIPIGKVISSHQNMVTIALTDELSKDDGIRIVGDVEDGITVNQIYKNNKLLTKAYGKDIVTIRAHKNLNKGSIVYKTTSSELLKEIKNSAKNVLKIIIDGKVYLNENRLVLEINDGINEVRVVSQEVMKSDNVEFIDRIKAQLLKTSSSPYHFNNLEIVINQKIFLPIKDINALRREAFEQLSLIRMKHHQNRLINKNEYNEVNKINDLDNNDINLKVKIRTEEQLLEVVSLGVKNIYIESYILYKKYSGKEYDVNFYYYNPRVGNNVDLENKVTSSIGNIKGAITSIYMNISNSYAVNLLHKLGAKTIGLSLELSKDQIKDMINQYCNRYHETPNLEMLVYGHYELMMMKYCLISKTNKVNKGCNLCMQSLNYLIDRVGEKYPLIKDKYCNLKILNSKPTSLHNYLEEITSLGVKNLLLDFSIEDKETVYKITKLYLDTLNGIKSDIIITNTTLGHYLEGVL